MQYRFSVYSFSRIANFTRAYKPRLLFTLTVFLSAFLLFLVQPLMARLILPLLGGSPAVWQTSMMFFQLLLLGGYFYVHLTRQYLDVARQWRLHVCLLVASLLFLPLSLTTMPGMDGPEQPVTWLVLALLMSVSLPFFVLSASAPLLQRWFSLLDDPAAGNPYFLYSASNLGSMIALLGYPFFIEPAFGLGAQTSAWTNLYCLFACLILFAILLLKPRPDIETASHNAAEKITWLQKARWFTLSFVPSGLMLGVTTFITTDIAAVPLLWVIPLAIYLFTFVLCFAPRMPFAREAKRFAPGALVFLAYLMNAEMVPSLPSMVCHLLVFFLLAMLCHGQLAAEKPHPSRLTEFYVWLSLGGAAGGLFNALIAPAVFTSAYEYPLLLVLAAFLIPRERSGKWSERLLDFILPVMVALAVTNLPSQMKSPFIPEEIRYSVTNLLPGGQIETALYHFILIICCIMVGRLSTRRPVRLGLCIAVLLFLQPDIYERSEMQELYRDRNFFGISRVNHSPSMNLTIYYHGTTLHGQQSTEKGKSLDITSYYAAISELLNTLPPDVRRLPYAITGLGAGTLTCYGLAGQDIDIYEIDEAVKQIASNPKLFTYLRDCQGNKNIILGDARLKLGEADDHRYGAMLMDAYTSDSLPIHLITREALALYVRKLAPGGVIAFHISNRHINLEPVLANLASDLRLVAYGKRFPSVPGNPLVRMSHWVIMARSAEDFGTLLQETKGWRKLEANSAPLWTDDYTNILSVLN